MTSQPAEEVVFLANSKSSEGKGGGSNGNRLSHLPHVLRKGSLPSRKSAGSVRGKRCCTCKCWAISGAVLVVVLGAVVLGGYIYYKKRMDDAMVGGASSADSELWAGRLGTGGGAAAGASISGEYLLVSYTKDYEDYLQMFGMPSFVVSFILGAKEKVVVEEPEEEGGVYVRRTITGDGFRKREVEFRLGEEFTSVWGRNSGNLHVVCTRPENLTLRCVSEERDQGWRLTSEMVFRKHGMVNTRTFRNSDSERVAKKFYKREGATLDQVPPWDADTVNLADQTDNPDNPFSDGGDDTFSFGEADEKDDDWGSDLD